MDGNDKTSAPQAIPITVFTGFVGAGKTTLILNLLPQLPSDYRVCILKNELGDVEIDSKLAQQSSVAGVSEILNGCLCCTLTGQMRAGIMEIKGKYAPDRILVEASGSAFPATLALQIKELERDTAGALRLDGVITVIDCENFRGYEDTSPTAKMQARYTDLLLLNKHENLSERALDVVLDHVFELNEDTPKLKTKAGSVEPSVVFGLDSALLDKLKGASSEERAKFGVDAGTHSDEIETVSVWKGGSAPGRSNHHHDHGSLVDCSQDGKCVDGDQQGGERGESLSFSPEQLIAALDALSTESVWRVKGFVRLSSPPAIDGYNASSATPLPSNVALYICNWAFGRHSFTPVGQGVQADIQDIGLRLTMMGARGELKSKARKFALALGANVNF